MEGTRDLVQWTGRQRARCNSTRNHKSGAVAKVKAFIDISIAVHGEKGHVAKNTQLDRIFLETYGDYLADTLTALIAHH